MDKARLKEKWGNIPDPRRPLRTAPRLLCVLVKQRRCSTGDNHLCVTLTKRLRLSRLYTKAAIRSCTISLIISAGVLRQASALAVK